MPEADFIEVSGHQVRIRRHPRAKRLTLRISAQGPVLTLPRRAAMAKARDFLHDHAAWLEEKLHAVPPRIPVMVGRTIPFAGQSLHIVAANDRKASVQDGRLLVPANDPAKATKKFLMDQARQDLTAATIEYASRIDKNFGKITLRDTRSRWGSCTSRGDLNYSWRLIMAPSEVLDYVAAHEVAHLAQMNHSPKYWAIVAKICPDYHVYRNWLRANGAELHRYDFGP